MGLSKVPGLSTCHTSPVRAKRWAGVGEFRAEGRSAALLLFQRPPFAGLFCLCLCRELWRRDRRIRARLSLSTCSSSLQQHVSAGTEGLWHFSCKTQHRESMGWALLACRGTLRPAWAVLSRGCRKKGSVWLSLVSWGLSPWAWFPPWACNTSSASGPWAKHCPRGPGPSGCAQLFSPMGALMPCLTPAWSLFPPGPWTHPTCLTHLPHLFPASLGLSAKAPSEDNSRQQQLQDEAGQRKSHHDSQWSSLRARVLLLHVLEKLVHVARVLLRLGGRAERVGQHQEQVDSQKPLAALASHGAAVGWAATWAHTAAVRPRQLLLVLWAR